MYQGKAESPLQPHSSMLFPVAFWGVLGPMGLIKVLRGSAQRSWPMALAKVMDCAGFAPLHKLNDRLAVLRMKVGRFADGSRDLVVLRLHFAPTCVSHGRGEM